MPLVLAAADRTLETATPQIWNSGHTHRVGGHLTSSQFVERLLVKGVQISVDGRGRALDNAFTERLWRSVKYEEVYLHEYETLRRARCGLNRYLKFYDERLYQTLDYRTPAEMYFDRGLLP